MTATMSSIDLLLGKVLLRRSTSGVVDSGHSDYSEEEESQESSSVAGFLFVGLLSAESAPADDDAPPPQPKRTKGMSSTTALGLADE